MIWKTGFWLGAMLAWGAAFVIVGTLPTTVRGINFMCLSALAIIPGIMVECALIAKFFSSFCEMLDNSGKSW